jgi:hypothetical protein
VYTFSYCLNLYVYTFSCCLNSDLSSFAPQVSERDSLWENPHATTTSWRSCVERRSDEIDLLVFFVGSFELQIVLEQGFVPNFI